MIRLASLTSTFGSATGCVSCQYAVPVETAFLPLSLSPNRLLRPLYVIVVVGLCDIAARSYRRGTLLLSRRDQSVAHDYPYVPHASRLLSLLSFFHRCHVIPAGLRGAPAIAGAASPVPTPPPPPSSS